MAGEVSRGGAGLLKRLTAPVASIVAAVVILAWVVTWATMDVTMALLGLGGMTTGIGPVELALFFTILIVMMVAMMLPSALPMIIAYHELTRLEGGRPVKRADNVATGAFVAPYFLIWGAFAVAALIGLMALGALGPFQGPLVFVPAFVLIAAGAYQMTRAKDVCLSGCQSPMSFVMLHWRSGRRGALRMGTRHAVYCLGCCWLFMVALFVVGAMSLLWMGAISVVIFAEKVGTRQVLLSRGVGVVLIVLGTVVAAYALVAG